MTESDAHTVSYTWSQEPKTAADHQAHLRDLLRQKQALEAITVPLFGHAESTRTVWPGKGYELARKVRDELIQTGKDISKPKELTRALEHACQHYQKPNGGFFDPKSLREGLRQWEMMEQGRRRPRRNPRQH